MYCPPPQTQEEGGCFGGGRSPGSLSAKVCDSAGDGRAIASALAGVEDSAILLDHHEALSVEAASATITADHHILYNIDLNGDNNFME